MIPETENLQEPKMSILVSLRSMLRLIRIDTLRRVHNVGFLVGRLICNFQHISIHLTQQMLFVSLLWQKEKLRMRTNN